jgi:distribution and morphology protein 31
MTAHFQFGLHIFLNVRGFVMSSSFTALRGALSRRPGGLALNLSTRKPAAVDRYTLIRSFFAAHASSQRNTSSGGALLLATSSSRSESGPLSGTSCQIVALHRPFTITHVQRKDSTEVGSSNPRPTQDPSIVQSSPQDAQQPISSERDVHHPPPNFDNYPTYFKRLALSLPHLQRPTRDDFLKVASGFWARARIRFKWFTIKSFRKFNADDISAFVTWFLMSQTLWILVGT